MLEITTDHDLRLGRQRLGLCQLKEKKKDGPRKRVENRKEIPASISPARKGIKRDRPISELTDQCICSGLVCTLCPHCLQRLDWCTYLALDKVAHNRQDVTAGMEAVVINSN